jgi:nondiscriminating glutamyl-tRNA synthetase
MSHTTRVRFAPSPTGHLHIGGARTALFNWLFAKHTGGSFVVRIEDTDVSRSTAESEKSVLDDLRWLGLLWDEGPDVGGDYGPYRQSERGEIYRRHAERLLEEGRAFRCFCTDEELEAARKHALEEGRIPQYEGACRHLTADEEAERREARGEPAVRFRGPTEDVQVEDLVRGVVEFGAAMLGDFIVMRSDGRPTYNFAAVVDDALMKITHVIRAEEHLPNTMRQVLLYEALGYDLPTFAHVSLIVDRDRSKLSKRRGATSVAEFREQGYLAEALVNYLALLGWSHPEGRDVLSRDELVESFELGRVSPSSAAFDEEKLTWLNAHHIREEPIEVIAALARTFAERGGAVEPDPGRHSAIVELVRDSIERLSEIPDAISYFVMEDYAVEDEARALIESDEGRRVLASLLGILAESEGELRADDFTAGLKHVGKTLGVKGKALYMPVRGALTGRTHGPSLGRTAELLGRGRVTDRLARATEGGAT